MTREDVVRLFEEWEALWAQRDPTVLGQMYAPDCRITSPIFAALEESNRRLFAAFPDWHLATERMLIDGHSVVQVIKVTGTHAGEFMGLPGSGRKMQFHGARIMDLENGLIKNEQRLYDFTLLLMQVGVLRAKPGH